MTRQSGERRTILLVDDHRDTVLATRIFLESEGYEVMEAYDGIQALEILKTSQPDLVILDVIMPRLDGWGALEKMQADERLRNIPVIMLTALGDPAHMRTGIDRGCTWYYTKPITNYADFSLVVRRILEGLEPPPEKIEEW